MKRTILFFTAVAGFVYFTMSSYSDGPAKNHNKGDLTTATGSCGGGGCHGNAVTDATTLLYLADPTTGAPLLNNSNYQPTKTYLLKLNTSRLGAQKFGFQISATDTNHTVNCGTLIATATGVNSVSSSVTGTVSLLEHATPLVASASSISIANSWIAPNSGHGKVSLNAIILAANGNGNADANDVYYHITVNYLEPTSVNDLPSSIAITAYPNPTQNNFNLKFENAISGKYLTTIYDLNGRKLQQQEEQINNSAILHFNTENLSKGMYLVHVEKDGAQRVLPITIQ